MARLTVVADEAALAATGAARVASLMTESIEPRGSAFVCLTGGSTPRRLYTQLAVAPVEWPRVHLFWGDERHVPPDHPDSNFGMANEALISRVAIPPQNVHRIPAEMPDAAAAARAYEEQIRGVTFDMMLLGLGPDGHIASIFPGSDLLSDRGADLVRSANASPTGLAPQVGRITLTPRALLDARAVLMIVSGAAKAGAVDAALTEPDDVAQWPVHLLRAAGDRVEWLLDEAAASQL